MKKKWVVCIEEEDGSMYYEYFKKKKDALTYIDNVYLEAKNNEYCLDIADVALCKFVKRDKY